MHPRSEYFRCIHVRYRVLNDRCSITTRASGNVRVLQWFADRASARLSQHTTPSYGDDRAKILGSQIEELVDTRLWSTLAAATRQQYSTVHYSRQLIVDNPCSFLCILSYFTLLCSLICSWTARRRAAYSGACYRRRDMLPWILRSCTNRKRHRVCAGFG